MNKKTIEMLKDLKMIELETIECTKEEYDANPDIQAHATVFEPPEYYIYKDISVPEDINFLTQLSILKEVRIIKGVCIFFLSAYLVSILGFIYMLTK